MTFQQSLELAEIEADLVFERYIDAFNADDHPEAVDRLSIDAQIAQTRYDEITNLVPAQCVGQITKILTLIRPLFSGKII